MEEELMTRHPKATPVSHRLDPDLQGKSTVNEQQPPTVLIDTKQKKNVFAKDDFDDDCDEGEQSEDEMQMALYNSMSTSASSTQHQHLLPDRTQTFN